MATITKRTDTNGLVSYGVRVRLKGVPTQTATFKRLTDAKRWVQETEAAIRAGRYFQTLEAQRHTLSELLDRYELAIMPNKKQSTQKSQRQHIKWWRNELGALTLNNITPSTIADCRDDILARGRTPATANRYLGLISHVFTFAVKEKQWMDSNPCLKVTSPKEARGRTRFLSEDERNALLEACEASTCSVIYPAVLLALSTGMRRGEQFGLNWSDVNLNTGKIVLRDTKNGETRVTMATGRALDSLKELAKVRRIDTTLIFPAKARNTVKPICLDRPFRNALQLAGIEGFRWHDLRHSFASELAMSGATLAEIAECMGHKTLDMVKRYAHLTEGHVGSVIERMTSRVFGGE